jgi:hypothetical protein
MNVNNNYIKALLDERPITAFIWFTNGIGAHISHQEILVFVGLSSKNGNQALFKASYISEVLCILMV